MLLGSLSFATMAALTHALATEFDWQVIAFVRVALTLLLSIALAWLAGAPFVVFRPRSLWVRSLAGSISLVCSFYAFTHLPISDVLTLTNVFPIWLAIMSGPVLNEPSPPSVWIAVVCGVVGVVLVQQPHLAAGNRAALVALASSFSTAIAMMGLHRLHDIDARAIVVHFSGVSLLFCLAAMFCFERGALPMSLLPISSVLLLLGVGVCATTGQLLLTKAFASAPPAKVSVVGLTQIVFALAYDIVIWKREVSALSLLGTVLVLAPTAWLLTRRRQPEQWLDE